MLRRRQRVQFRPNVDASTSRGTDSDVEPQESLPTDPSTDTNLQAESSNERTVSKEPEASESVSNDQGLKIVFV